MRYLLMLLLCFVMIITVSAQAENFELLLLHSSTVLDNHRIGADNIGGTSRVSTLLREARENYANVLLFDMGDRFINPFYFERNAEIMNTLGYNAMTMGNHEFNGGNTAVANFLESLDFPILAANIDFSASPLLAERILPYTILELNGEQIGVIGLAEEASAALSSPGPDLIFLTDEVSVTQAYVDELTAMGVNKILLLAHREANENVVLASSLAGVDVILGGSDDILLSNSSEDAVFPYPIEATSLSNEPVLVVQTPEGNRYFGELLVNFDDAGVLSSWSGDNRLLDETIPVDEEFATLLEELYANDVANVVEVGVSEVELVGGDPCREEECTMGNLIADAMRYAGATQVAVANAGGIRASIGIGAITDVQILQVLPFGNLLSTMELHGEDMLVMLEHGVSLGGDATAQGAGRFLQVSGMRYSWNPTRPVGSRIETMEILNADGTYSPLVESDIYSIATNDFMRSGGDEYSMLAENAIDPFDFGPAIDQVLLDYVVANSPITTQIEGRITRLGE